MVPEFTKSTTPSAGARPGGRGPRAGSGAEPPQGRGETRGGAGEGLGATETKHANDRERAKSGVNIELEGRGLA